jgi:hypothetical protein
MVTVPKKKHVELYGRVESDYEVPFIHTIGVCNGISVT